MTSGRIAACLLNARGDYLLNLPALRALSSIADGELVLVVRRGATEMALRDVAAVGVVEVDATYVAGGYRFDTEWVATTLARWGPLEAFLSLNPWSSVDLDRLAREVAAHETIGLGDGPWMQSVALDFSCHSSELAFRVAQRIDPTLRADAFVYPPAHASEAARFARSVRDDIGDAPLLVVHRDTKHDKQWLDRQWVAAVGQWLAENPCGVAVDLGLMPLTVDAATVPDRFLHGLALPLDCALALTTVADLFVGVDSCFLHAADLARVAAVGLFFATNPVEFGLRWSARRHVRADEPSLLEPAEVADALRAVAAEHRAERRCVPNATCALAPVGIGTANYSFANDLSAIGSLIGALQLGCNVVDVAGNHGGGDGGAVVGMALRRAIAGGIVTREQLFLCGKAGFTEHLATTQSRAIRAWAAAGHCIDVDFLAWEFERQTRWLGVDALDAFLLQNPEEALLRLGEDAFWTAVQSAFDYFEDLIECGRLRSYGVSTAEALRVDRESPFHLDLGDLSATARRSGGRSHGFRVLELPVGATHLEATEVRAHRRPEHDERDLTALEWAEREGMIVFASTPLNGGHDIESYGNAIADIVGLSEPGANLLQFARSLPGVTAALVGVTNPAHLTAVREVLDCAPIT